MWLLAASSILLATSALAAPPLLEAFNAQAVPANQLNVSGNACGPTALLNAFRFSNNDWQRALTDIHGNNDRERILRIIREIGMRPSKHTPGHARWSRRGVSVADLKDMANEMCIGKFLPLISEEVFFLQPGEIPEKLLRRVHRHLSTSLIKGLPPVISLRRYALRRQDGGASQWIVLDAHFVTLTCIPRKLDSTASSFAVGYIDPWGGHRCQGVIRIPETSFLADSKGRSSCLEAAFPQTSAGKKLVRRNELSVLAISAAIGRW
jgi:hypothetical protein